MLYTVDPTGNRHLSERLKAIETGFLLPLASTNTTQTIRDIARSHDDTRIICHLVHGRRNVTPERILNSIQHLTRETAGSVAWEQERKWLASLQRWLQVDPNDRIARFLMGTTGSFYFSDADHIKVRFRVILAECRI